jgi:hypothetical protein
MKHIYLYMVEEGGYVGNGSNTYATIPCLYELYLPNYITINIISA